MLAKSPGFTAVAVVVLALGIGANTAIFSLVNAMLLKPLAGEDRPGQLVGVYSRDRTRPDAYRAFSYPNYEDIRTRTDLFSEVAAFNLALVGITEADVTHRVFAAVVSSNYFAVFGVTPLAGRAFNEAEERPGSRVPVVIASYDYWKKTGSDPAVVGKTLRINARPFTVVAVAPRGFTGTSALISPDVYLPLGMYEVVVNDVFREGPHTELSDRANDALLLLGRLRPGLTLETADRRLLALSAQLEQAYPAENRNQTLVVHRLARLSISTNPRDDREILPVSAIMMAMAAIVLLIACLNLANMQLARGTARRKEIAIRLAIGSGRAPIVRQLLTEGLVLSLLGAAAGLLLAFWATRLLVASFGPAIPIAIAFDARPDVRVLAATLGFAAFSTLVFGLGPAWKLARTNVVSELKEQVGEQPAGTVGRRFGLRNLLVVAQIALSLGLLTAAGLFIRAGLKAADADPGFSLDREALVTVDPSLAGYDDVRGRAVYRRLLERLRSVPGVEAASAASVVPFGDFSEGKTVKRGGESSGPASKESDRGVRVNYYIVGADYFRSLGLRMLRGREFAAAEEDSASGSRVAIIDEPLATRLFPNTDPLGQYVVLVSEQAPSGPQAGVSVRSDDTAGNQPMLIVGVAPGVRHSLFDQVPQPHLYVPAGQQYRAAMNIHLRLASSSRAVESAVLQAVRGEIRALDEHLPVLGLKTMREHRAKSAAVWIVQTGANLFSVFGGVAVLLAVFGIYAVKAYVVARRTREIGIRMALGATPHDVRWMVLREGMVLTVGGVAVGLALAAILAKAVSSMLYQVSTFDPLIFTAAPLVLAAVAMLACYVPAYRATKVVPLSALRFE
jgi:predicted permease